MSTSSCVAASFPAPQLPGADFLAIEAGLVTNYNQPIPKGWRFSQPGIDVRDATFCNVTLTYTHPGQNDTINVEVWLPLADEWNGRLQAVGGGSWHAGRFPLSFLNMAGAVAEGYATVTTDAGLGDAYDPFPWSFVSPGNINLYALQNLGFISLGDEAVIAKDVIKNFYGKGPSYSYWNGCSQGGRQGTMLAQQYPSAYDGIISAAPAVHWAEMFMSNIWPTVYMDITKQYPRGCELNELTSLAVYACDGLDGVKDGLIADPDGCRAKFDPFDYVGTWFTCSDNGNDETVAISEAAAAVAEAAWNGPVFSNGKPLWPGFEIGADLAGIAPTNCTSSGCVAARYKNLEELYKGFLIKDITLDVTNLTHREFDTFYRLAKRTFQPFLSTDEHDLSDFRDAGGKMITFHGLTDSAIPPSNSLAYYKDVAAFLGDTTDFYRYYRVPGLDHCLGGPGGQPESLFAQLREWVEKGKVPEESPVIITTPDNTTQQQVLCVYPKRAVLDPACSDTNSTKCWSCTEVYSLPLDGYMQRPL
ncbi:hypothetical protein NM208_g7977 [Fusarium decemcellulare]|uniref:Uncharacterized protein n=1 Tax=Fusarium decemcellulare TaxID=57161 RepID=A0ACC1S763_9HYPO|nr:hypothetical protein NM208_g7977 [Fusarium decemcellulare]